MVNIANMNAMIDLMENYKTRHPEIEFDLGTWINSEWCGTTACSLGTAALDPVFQAQGWFMKYSFITYAPQKPGYRDPITGDTRYGLGAAEKFFNISERVSRWLFSPGSYCSTTFDYWVRIFASQVTTQDVARRCKAVLRYNEMKLAAYARYALDTQLRKQPVLPMVGV